LWPHHCSDLTTCAHDAPQLALSIREGARGSVTPARALRVWWVLVAPLLLREHLVGTRPRSKPKYLAAKLLAIRQQLGLSQSEIATQIGLTSKNRNARVSEYENDKKEPPLALLLRYARLARVCTCVLIDDQAELTSKSHRRSRNETCTKCSDGALIVGVFSDI
jgi:DNA-binding XRE family transcriptional regulator